MSNDNRREPETGPMGGPWAWNEDASGEKAKDFKGTMKTLMSYLGKYKLCYNSSIYICYR
ncbi:MAG: hypothetical protein ACLTDP_06085 [Terrisporobacter sp.]